MEASKRSRYFAVRGFARSAFMSTSRAPLELAGSHVASWAHAVAVARARAKRKVVVFMLIMLPNNADKLLKKILVLTFGGEKC